MLAFPWHAPARLCPGGHLGLFGLICQGGSSKTYGLGPAIRWPIHGRRSPTSGPAVDPALAERRHDGVSLAILSRVFQWFSVIESLAALPIVVVTSKGLPRA